MNRFWRRLSLRALLIFVRGFGQGLGLLTSLYVFLFVLVKCTGFHPPH